MYAMFLYM